jgi:hypothetical protein
VAAGTYPRQTITARFGSTVRVVGESVGGVVVTGLNVTGSSHVAFSTMTITTAGSTDGQSAVRIYGGASYIDLDKVVVAPRSHAGVEVHNYNGAPHDIRVRDSRITGAQSSGTTTGRNVWIGDLNGGDATTWPTNIEISHNDLGYATADAIHISGGTAVTIAGNEIHDIAETDDHNDGVQAVASRNLTIFGNRISSPGTWTCATCVPPDQAIIVGHAYPSAANKQVVGTFIADNIIHHWRGKGILLGGSIDTRVVNNTVTHLGPAGSTVASVTVAEPYSYRNEQLRIWNNVLDRYASAASVPLAYIGHNCIGAGGVGEATVSADPAFSDVTREFTLSDLSPCLDMGWQNTSWETPTVDFAGLPVGTPPDLGARQHPDAKPASTPISEPSPTGTVATTTTTTAPAPTTTTTTAPAPTTTTTAPTTATSPLTVGEVLNGSFGGRGGARSITFTTGSGQLTGAVEISRADAVKIEVYASGSRIYGASLGNGQTFAVGVPAGPVELVASATGQLRYTVQVTHPA